MKIKNIICCLLLLLLNTICFGQDYFIQKISGDKQLAVRNTELKNNLVVRLVDKYNVPVSNVGINFFVVDNSSTITNTQNIDISKKNIYLQMIMVMQKQKFL